MWPTSISFKAQFSFPSNLANSFLQLFETNRSSIKSTCKCTPARTIYISPCTRDTSPCTRVPQEKSKKICEAFSRYPRTKSSLFSRRWCQIVNLVEIRFPRLLFCSESYFFARNNWLKKHMFPVFFFFRFFFDFYCDTRVQGDVSPEWGRFLPT